MYQHMVNVTIREIEAWSRTETTAASNVIRGIQRCASASSSSSWHWHWHNKRTNRLWMCTSKVSACNHWIPHSARRSHCTAYLENVRSVCGRIVANRRGSDYRLRFGRVDAFHSMVHTHDALRCNNDNVTELTHTETSYNFSQLVGFRVSKLGSRRDNWHIRIMWPVVTIE